MAGENQSLVLTKPKYQFKSSAFGFMDVVEKRKLS
jgi:hypothetical protein